MWIKLSDRMPDENIVGKKILVCRVGNASQGDPRSIFDTRMIKLCNPDETWWQPMEDVPQELIEILNQTK